MYMCMFIHIHTCMIAILFSFRSQASHFLSLLFLHVVTVTTFALDFNKAAYGNSGGSESYLVCRNFLSTVAQRYI